MTRPAPEIPGIPTHLWVVDEFLDVIRKKPYRDAIRLAWGSTTPVYPLRLETEAEAVHALLKRAEERVSAAEQEAEKERARLKRLRKKYGAEG